MTADRPDRCNYPLRVGHKFIHTCDARFGQPIEPATERHLKAVS